MESDIDDILKSLDKSMQHAVDYLDSEMAKVRAGRANPAMLEGVKMEYYGQITPLNQVANVNTPDGRTLSIQPWEKGMLPEIEKAIMNSNLGLNPQNNGEMVIISLPPLTEERRKQLVKTCRAEGENAKVSIRNYRKDGMDQLKKLKNDGMPEDVIKDAENDVQKLTDKYTKMADEYVDSKEKDIMTV